MHILVLNEYFPPDTSATAKNAALVVEALSKRHRVTVLAGRPSYDPVESYPWRLLRKETYGNVTIERVGSTAFPRFRMKQRLANYLSYLALALPRALALRADVIVAMTDPPIEGIAGAAVAKLAGRPFLYNIRDMYPDMAVGGGIIQASRWTERWERAHVWAMRSASRVVVLGEDMRERVLAKGIDPTRVAVVRDAVPFQQVPPSDHPIVREIRGNSRLVLIHAGNVGFYGAWKTLIRGAEILAAEGVELVFIGEGVMKPQVEREARNCRNVRFLPFRPADEIPYVMAAGDLHVITIKRGLEGIVVPSKLYNILAAGRPILAVATNKSEVARFAERDGCGLAADPDDPAAMAEAVKAVLHAPELLALMSQRSHALARRYDRTNELTAFVRAVEGARGEYLLAAR